MNSHGTLSYQFIMPQISVWGGPLRVQASMDYTSSKRDQLKHVFTNPGHILQWMQEPAKWIRIIPTRTSRSFDPNPLFFPVAWSPLRLFQMVVMAKVSGFSSLFPVFFFSLKDVFVLINCVFSSLRLIS